MGVKDRLKKQLHTATRRFGYEIHRVPSQTSIEAMEARALPEGIRRVHYGCGEHIEPEWLNVDLGPPKKGITIGLHFLAVDLAREHPFPNDSFELGYAEDFLEHISQAQSLVFLTEAHRTLRRGGVLRLSFPGLEGVLRKHYTGTSVADLERAQREAYEQWGHVHFYSRDELRLVAEHVGFRGVEFFSFQQSSRPELGRMDTRSDQADLNTYTELRK
jgi:predicted SAM-dependent methyltransferase